MKKPLGIFYPSLHGCGIALTVMALLSALESPAQDGAAKEPRTPLVAVILHVNQVGYDQAAPKVAVVETAAALTSPAKF